LFEIENLKLKLVDNDIAILRISPPVELDRTSPIVPACVVASKQIDFTGAYATVVGFGGTQDIPTISFQS